MADIGISYSAHTEPGRVGAQFGMQFAGTTLRATIRSVDNFIIVLTPSGNVGEEILSGVAYPIAQTLGLALPSLARGLINGHSFDVTTIGPSTKTIAGENLTISVSDLNVSNFNGMLLVQGGVNVS